MNKIKIFGICAVALLLLMTAVPMVSAYRYPRCIDGRDGVIPDIGPRPDRDGHGITKENTSVVPEKPPRMSYEDYKFYHNDRNYG